MYKMLVVKVYEKNEVIVEIEVEKSLNFLDVL